MALMSDPSRLPDTVTDLTVERPEMWPGFENYARTKYVDNEAHLNIVLSLKEVRNQMTACIGPPGTGKTTVLADVTIGSVLCGNTTLVCAVSNNAVDKAANSVWEAFPEKERRKYKFLRYETTSAEMQAILTRANYRNPVDQDENARPAYKAAANIDDDDVILRAMAQVATANNELNEELSKLCYSHRDLTAALKEKQKIDEKKRSNVPAAMTLANRMFHLTWSDQINAEADFNAEMTAHASAKFSAEEIEQYRLKGQEEYRTEAVLTALAQDPLNDAEIAARVADGRILSPEACNKSYRYRMKLDEYCLASGNVSKQDRLAFEDLRDELVIRVFKETHVVFCTCSNAGSELGKLGFSPKFIQIDEAEQLKIAAFANVSAAFFDWVAIFIFGDPKQLKPFLLSGRANELVENTLLSILTLFQEKGNPILTLVYQYRMAPAIVQWVSTFSYKSLLKNHPSVLEDNAFRQVARQISKDVYSIDGPDGHGSEYWMVDVANGVSQVQRKGTSLPTTEEVQGCVSEIILNLPSEALNPDQRTLLAQNYANATAIAELVDQALKRKVPREKITVLVYYAGQLSLIVHRLEETTTEKKWRYGPGSEISTVDAFQGEENEFVFIDIVVAHQEAPQKHTGADAEDSEDDSPEGFKRSGRVTAHVKSPNRLCCALTRGRSCVIVVCQLAAILDTVKKSQLKASASVSCMAKDLLDRRLVSHDYASMDTSPAGEEMRAAWDQTKLESELHRRKMEHYGMLSTQKSRANNARFADKPRDAASRVYRTGSRRTTRPNLSGVVVDAAETADIASGRNRSTLETEAGAVTLATGSGTQNAAKQEKKAKKEARRKAVAEEAAEEASSGKGKGKAKAMPVDPKGKGKAKEVDDPSAMDTT